MSRSAKLFLTFIISFIAAIYLSLLPLPNWANWFRPEWILLVLIYWIIALPSRVSIGVGWGSGLLLDVLYGSVLGEHAIAMVVTTFLVVKFRTRLRNYNLVHASYFVFVFMLLYQATLFCVLGLIGNAPNSIMFWLPCLTSALLWPWVYALLQDLTYRFKLEKDSV